MHFPTPRNTAKSQLRVGSGMLVGQGNITERNLDNTWGTPMDFGLGTRDRTIFVRHHKVNVTFPEEGAVIIRAIQQHGLQLFVIDPTGAELARNVNPNRGAQVQGGPTALEETFTAGLIGASKCSAFCSLTVPLSGRLSRDDHHRAVRIGDH